MPDSYGVFKWVLDYRRLGYSYIEMTGGCALRLGRCIPLWVTDGVAQGTSTCACTHRAGLECGCRFPEPARAWPLAAPPQSETVPIRPFKHNEYERFIGQAFPYYASAASMMAGFLALGALLSAHLPACVPACVHEQPLRLPASLTAHPLNMLGCRLAPPCRPRCAT